MARQEYQLCRRQLHICMSLVTISQELEDQQVLEQLVEYVQQHTQGTSDVEQKQHHADAPPPITTTSSSSAGAAAAAEAVAV